MGSRGRSIRLRIYALVAVPLVTMISLLAYIATTSIHNVSNLERAPSLINATSVPAAEFTNYLEAERLAAVVYIFEPSAPNLQAYQNAIGVTNAKEAAFTSQMESSDTKSSETASIAQGIAAVVANLRQLNELRQGVEARELSPGVPMTGLDALGAYAKGIAAEPQLFLDESATMTNATAASQSLGLIGAVSAREALSQEDALLSGMFAANKASAADRAAFTEMVATRESDIQDADYLLNATNLKIFNAPLAGSAALQQQLAQIEGAVSAGVPMNRLPVTESQWQTLTGALQADYFNGADKDAQAQLAVDRQITNSAKVRLYYTAAIALLGLLLTIFITTLVGRSIIRRLRGLETSALALAEDQLPDVIARLRRGDDVDMAVEAPPLRVGTDEIGRVGQAFDLVRQTAIRSAVEEAKLRRGINDVFRSLARRSQSLLHRQLTLLDQMERRASDPEALDDLFRLDHLTTRMRRHAEGLVILAGAPAGRGWSSPVRMVDIMRGAIAEVEDYARVSVATRSQAALSGSAVADVIHLLAELIENATTLSPPYTSVRVSGDTVANGFAIEVEDRGLGISAQRLAELNDRLTNPPEFNPADSEQLGLFVVSQLARRHGIRVALKASPFGGTDAVVLIPRHLVVAEDAFQALPGEPAAAIMATPLATNGNHFATGELASGAPLNGGSGTHDFPGTQSFPSTSDFPGAAQFPDAPFPGTAPFPDAPFPDAPFPEPPGFPGKSHLPGAPAFGSTPQFPSTPSAPGEPDGSSGPRISGPLRRAHGDFADGQPRGGHHAPPRGGGSTGRPFAAAGTENTAGSDSPAGSDSAAGSESPAGTGSAARNGNGPTSGNGAGNGNGHQTGGSGSGTLADTDLTAGEGTGFDLGELPRRTRTGTGTNGAGQPPAGPKVPAFDVFAAQRQEIEAQRQETEQRQDNASLAAGITLPDWPTVQGASATSSTPTNETGARVSVPPWELSSDPGPQLVPPTDRGADPPDGPGQAEGDHKGLPRRVRQASIAPQLRGDPAARKQQRTSTGDTGGLSVDAGPSPEEIRATMSALQRGWQEGRSRQAADGQPPWAQEAEGEVDAT
jgi:signal transduction histidine kinase